jgi:type I restriction enzyme S subunit
MSEALWDVPSSWAWVRICDVGQVVAGGTPSTKEPKFWGQDVVWFSPADLTGYSAKLIRRGAKGLSALGLRNSSARVMPAGSVMFSSRAPIGYVAINATDAATNQGFKSVVPSPAVFSDFLYYYLKASKQLAEERATGTTFKEISGSAFSVLPVPLPPLSEQHRIVAKIEALFSELDKAVESLTLAWAQLKTYRQALLKHAFEGKLTADWRAANADRLETPEALLSRIRKEREARYARAFDAWQTALAEWRAGGEVGRKPGRPSVLRDFGNDLNDIEIILPDLPSGWAWGRLGLASFRPEYGTSAKSAKDGEVPVIRMGNLQNGLIDWNDLVYTSDADEIEKYQLESNDILFNRTNSPELVGKTVIYKGERPALFAGYLVRVNQIDTIVLPQYLCYFLNSHIARAHGNTVKTDGVNQSNINGSKLQDYPFPFCCLDEQAEIVSLLDERLSVIDAALADVEVHTAKANALRQSILKQAFSGQLVAQDPADEPASALLARLRGTAPVPKTRRKKTE